MYCQWLDVYSNCLIWKLNSIDNNHSGHSYYTKINSLIVFINKQEPGFVVIVPTQSILSAGNIISSAATLYLGIFMGLCIFTYLLLAWLCPLNNSIRIALKTTFVKLVTFCTILLTFYPKLTLARYVIQWTWNCNYVNHQ